MDQKRDFKGVWISKEVWLDERLNALEKIILVEIDGLDCEESGCYASNEYLAEFCQCSITKVSLGIKKLITLGYIYVVSFDGRTRFLKSRLSKNEKQDLKKEKADIQIMKENNIEEINKKNNKKYIYMGEFKRIKLTQEEYQKLVDEFGKEYIDIIIKKLDEYVESNNNKNKYSNFNLVIRKAINEKWFGWKTTLENESKPNGGFKEL